MIYAFSRFKGENEDLSYAGRCLEFSQFQH